MRIKYIFMWLKKEMVMTIAVALALLASCYQLPKLSYIDGRVLIILFNLMLIIAAFRHYQLLDFLALSLMRYCKSFKMAGVILTSLTFVAAMFMTNDVALLTFVPLMMILGKKLEEKTLKWVVFQTLAANLGSALTPMGNPQNLYIFTHYGIGIGSFLKITSLLLVLGALFMGILFLLEKGHPLTIEMNKGKIRNPKKLVGFGILFVIVLASVVRCIDYRIAFALVVIYTAIVQKELFRKVDYTLIITFIGFFIFVGTLGEVPTVKVFLEGLLSRKGNTYLSGLVLSQVISNVPATMLLASFTENWQELVLGVNIGGLGTLIASLASVISYKLYTAEYPEEQGKFMKCFTIYNVIGLVSMGVIAGVFVFFV